MADRLPIDGRIAQANGRLKAGRVRCKIERVSNRLYLRATLPPKPSSNRTDAFQQRIATGFSANAKGLSLAEAEAKTIAGLVDAGRFDWVPYTSAGGESIRRVEDWLEAFEADYFSRREKNPKSELTWKKDYRVALRQLPPGAELSPEVLMSAVLATTPDSKPRKRACMVYSALAKFAGIEIDLKPYRGNYSPSAVAPKDLPSDEAIADWFHRVPNPHWQQVYALLAIYGIRPSEVWFLDLSDFPVLTVMDGKTKSRRVWPYYPEWIEWVQLETPLPKVSGPTADDLGHRVATQFRRYAVPFAPKMLRHAWAVRTISFGLDTSIAARQMGHSEAVHCQVYHRWLNDRHYQAAFDRAQASETRPKAPTGTQVDK